MDQADLLNVVDRLTCQGLCCFLGQLWRGLCARVVLSCPDWRAESLTGTQLPLACDLFSIYIMFPNMFPFRKARLGATHRNIIWGAELL